MFVQLEMETNKQPIVFMKGFTFRELQHIIEYIYTGNITVEAKEYDSIVEALKFLKIPIDDLDQKHESDKNQENTGSVANNSVSKQTEGFNSKSTVTNLDSKIKKLPIKMTNQSKLPKKSKVHPTEEKKMTSKTNRVHNSTQSKPSGTQDQSPMKSTMKNQGKSGNYTCRFCNRLFQIRKPFELHQMRCFHNPQIAKKKCSTQQIYSQIQPKVKERR